VNGVRVFVSTDAFGCFVPTGQIMNRVRVFVSTDAFGSYVPTGRVVNEVRVFVSTDASLLCPYGTGCEWDTYVRFSAKFLAAYLPALDSSMPSRRDMRAKRR